MKAKSQYSCMYLVPPEIYTRLLDSADAREKIKVQELNTVEVGNENGAFPSLPDTPDHTADVNTSQDNNDDDDDNNDDDNNDDYNDGGYGGEYNPPPRYSSSSTSTQGRHSSSTDTASETERHFQNNRLNSAQNRAFQLLGDSDDDSEVFSNNFAQQPQLPQQSTSSFTSSNHNLNPPTNNQTLENNIGSELERVMNDMIKIKKTALQQQKILQNINKKAKSRFMNTSNIQTTQRAIEYVPHNAISQADISFTPPQNMNSAKAIEYHPQQTTISSNAMQDVNSNRALTTATVQADIPNIQDSNITQSNNGARKKSYVCEICKIVFISSRLLTQHKKDFHFPETKKIVAEKNKDRYINWDDSMIQDSSITQSENIPRKKKFVCDICKISFSTENLLANHKKDFHFPETGEVKRGGYVVWKNDKPKKKRKKKNTTIISLKSSDISMDDSIKSVDRGDVSMSDSIIIPRINDTLTPSMNNTSMDSISVLHCKLCPATFNTQIALNRHIRNIHEVDINYKNKNKRGLKRKIENTNGNITEKTSGRKKQATHFYKCKLCDTHFKDEKVLNRHVKNIHNSNSNYKYNLPQGEKRKREIPKNFSYKKWK